MGLLEILSAAKQVKTDIGAGLYVQAWRDTIPLQTGLMDIAESFGFKAGPGDAETIKEIHATVAECCTLLEHPILTDVPARTQTVGKLGDGTFLKLLLDALLKLLPVIIPLVI